MPPPNDRRRAQLADAAIALLVETGVHGVTHRAVERRAGLPVGTASNYFRSREALLLATAARIVALHQDEMARTERTYRPTSADPRERAAELLSASLLTAAGTYRDRYLAIFELQLESVRRPALAEALAGLRRSSVAFTAGHHARLDLQIPPDRVATLMTLYAGVLFALVSGPPDAVTEAAVRRIADAIVAAALGPSAAAGAPRTPRSSPEPPAVPS